TSSPPTEGFFPSRRPGSLRHRCRLYRPFRHHRRVRLDVSRRYDLPANPCCAYHKSRPALRRLRPPRTRRRRHGCRPRRPRRRSRKRPLRLLQSSLYHPRRQNHLPIKIIFAPDRILSSNLRSEPLAETSPEYLCSPTEKEYARLRCLRGDYERYSSPSP